MKINGTKILGLAALGAAFVLSAPVERAAAMSLSNPAAATAVQDNVKGHATPTSEISWRRHHWHHRYWRHHHWHRHWHHRHWR